MAVWRRTLAPAPVRWFYAAWDGIRGKAGWLWFCALALLGNALQFGAFGLFLQLNQRSPSFRDILVVSLEILVLTGIGRFLMRRYGAKVQALKANDVSDFRGNAAIYLRPFAHDGEIGPPVLDGFVFESMFFNAWTTESALVRAVEKVRPVFAVRDPRRPGPDLGAHRVSVSDDWKTSVLAMMDEAEIVILRVPDSADTVGTLWEIEQAVKRVPSEKLLFMFPGMGTSQTARAWDILRSVPGFERRFPGVEFPGARFAWIESGDRIVFSDGLPRASVREFRNALHPFLRRFDPSLGTMAAWESAYSWILSWRSIATVTSMVSGIILGVGMARWL